MRYLPKSPSERREMLDAIGVRSIEELFSLDSRGVPAASARCICPGRSRKPS